MSEIKLDEKVVVFCEQGKTYHVCDGKFHFKTEDKGKGNTVEIFGITPCDLSCRVVVEEENDINFSAADLDVDEDFLERLRPGESLSDLGWDELPGVYYNTDEVQY